MSQETFALLKKRDYSSGLIHSLARATLSRQFSAVATTVPVRLEIVLAVALRLRSFSLDLSAFTFEAITSCMEEAAISREDTITSSNLPLPLTTLSAASLEDTSN